MINLQEYESIVTHWIALYLNAENITYFDCFGVKHIPKKYKKNIGSKNIITHTYRMQTCNSIMCEYVCLGFIDFMLKIKTLLEYTNLFSPSKYEKNKKITLTCFQQNLNKLKE